MALKDVIYQIDQEIAKLQQARTLLSETEDALPRATRGRPKGSSNARKGAEATTASGSKRNLSPEGRKAIADAMKRRWADKRKAAEA